MWPAYRFINWILWFSLQFFFIRHAWGEPQKIVCEPNKYKHLDKEFTYIQLQSCWIPLLNNSTVFLLQNALLWVGLIVIQLVLWLKDQHLFNIRLLCRKTERGWLNQSQRKLTNTNCFLIETSLKVFSFGMHPLPAPNPTTLFLRDFTSFLKDGQIIETFIFKFHFLSCFYLLGLWGSQLIWNTSISCFAHPLLGLLASAQCLDFLLWGRFRRTVPCRIPLLNNSTVFLLQHALLWTGLIMIQLQCVIMRAKRVGR